MQGRSRTKLLTRFLAAAAMVAVYFAGALLPSSVLTSTSAEARGRGRGRGGRGRGRGRGWSGWRGRGRGRGGIYYYPGGGSCSYWSNVCSYRWGWGTGGWYRCMWNHGC
jgi:hypothetical protein